MLVRRSARAAGVGGASSAGGAPFCDEEIGTGDTARDPDDEDGGVGESHRKEGTIDPEGERACCSERLLSRWARLRGDMRPHPSSLHHRPVISTLRGQGATDWVHGRGDAKPGPPGCDLLWFARAPGADRRRQREGSGPGRARGRTRASREEEAGESSPRTRVRAGVSPAGAVSDRLPHGVTVVICRVGSSVSGTCDAGPGRRHV